MTFDQAAAALRNAYWAYCETLMFYHTTPWELDEALLLSGAQIGPCAAQDLFGLGRVIKTMPERPTPILKRMVAEGRLGKSAGVGFYRYPGGGGAVEDPLLEDMYREEAWFAGVERSELDAQTLQEKMQRHLRHLCQGADFAAFDPQDLMLAAVQ